MAKSDLDTKKLPRHVAIIMDGNGRWAKKHDLPRAAGHEAGAKSVRYVVEACRELGGIETLSLYAFSTENWQRSQSEVASLFQLLTKYISLEIENLHAEDIRVVFMGSKEGLSEQLLEDMKQATERTKNNASMVLNLAINYGSRAEIVDTCRAIAKEVKTGRLKVDDIDEGHIGDNLYVPEARDLELLIRTSGEMRISNFMNWQLSYAEIVVTSTLWPDFRKRNLYQCLKTYQSRGRRFGRR